MCPLRRIIDFCLLGGMSKPGLFYGYLVSIVLQNDDNLPGFAVYDKQCTRPVMKSLPGIFIGIGPSPLDAYLAETERTLNEFIDPHRQ